MMDNKMIIEGSLESSDKGFAFYGRLPYYRGLGLSMIEDIAVSVDGEAVARGDVRLHLHGNTYTLDQMETVYDDRWRTGQDHRHAAGRAGTGQSHDHLRGADAGFLSAVCADHQRYQGTGACSIIC